MQSNKTYVCSIAGCDATFTVIFDWTQHVRKHAHAVMISNNKQGPEIVQAPRAQAQAQSQPAPRAFPASSKPTPAQPRLTQNAPAMTARAPGAPEVTSLSTTRKGATPSVSTPARATSTLPPASKVSPRILSAAAMFSAKEALSVAPLPSSARKTSSVSAILSLLSAKEILSLAPAVSSERAASAAPAVSKTTAASTAPAMSSSAAVSSSTSAASFNRVVPPTRLVSLKMRASPTISTIPVIPATPAIPTNEATPPTSSTKILSTPQGSPKITTTPSSTLVAENGIPFALSVLATSGHRSTSDSLISTHRFPTPSSETSTASIENGIRMSPDIDIDIDICDENDAGEYHVDDPLFAEVKEEEEEKDAREPEKIFVCKLRDQVAKQAPSKGKATRSKGVALFSKDCTAVFDTEMDQIKHYLEHIGSLGPYLECPVKTCRMVVVSESMMEEHTAQLHSRKKTKASMSVPPATPSLASPTEQQDRSQRKRTRSQSKVEETSNVTATNAKRVASTGKSKERFGETGGLPRTSRKLAMSISSKEETDDSGDFQPQILGPFFTGRSTRK